MDSGRAFLESQVRTARERFEQASKAFLEAIDALSVSVTDLEAYQRVFEAYTRDSDARYIPEPIINPLDTLTLSEQSGAKDEKPANARPTKQEKTPPPPPMPTKRGIILEAVASGNGAGMSIGDIWKAIPEDVPLEVRKEDIYRALPSLLSQGKVWRDKRGTYHAGPKPLSESLEQSLLQSN